ncbi:MAG: hypothetical protein M3Z09_15645 [Acidobacteriota bacterium]|nr:hypothetical protein [Acidobacteriota bacterium]
MAGLDILAATHDPERLHPGDPRWELVVRIALSPGFRRAPRLTEFLFFVCDRVLRGETDDMTEQHIGIEVFKRSAGYSTTEDNVVRAQARQVRLKLGEYFATLGKDEDVILEIPKGSYVPVFSRRAEPAVVLPPAAIPVASAADPGSNRPGASWMRWIWPAVTAFLSIGLFLTLKEDSALQKRIALAPPPVAALLPPLSCIFDDRQPTTIVVADSGFGLYQDLLGRTATLDDYLNPGFFTQQSPRAKEARTFMQRLGTRQFSSYADLVLTQRILRLAAAYRDKTTVRFARDLHLRELNSGNFVFIGSSYSNPWVSLFRKRRNFPTALDAASRRGVVENHAPRPGEAASYLMKGEDGLSGSTFGVLTFLPADSESANILLLDGINMEGTEAAGTALTEPRAAQALLERIGLSASADRRYLEVVFETKAMAGTTRDTNIVAYRLGSPH